MWFFNRKSKAQLREEEERILVAAWKLTDEGIRRFSDLQLSEMDRRLWNDKVFHIITPSWVNSAINRLVKGGLLIEIPRKKRFVIGRPIKARLLRLSQEGKTEAVVLWEDFRQHSRVN